MMIDASTFNHELRKVGITERQIKSWVERGFLRPKDANPGKGNYRQWQSEELIIAKTLKRLRNVGFTLGAASEYARILVEQGTGFLDLDEKCTLMIEM